MLLLHLQYLLHLLMLLLLLLTPLLPIIYQSDGVTFACVSFRASSLQQSEVVAGMLGTTARYMERALTNLGELATDGGIRKVRVTMAVCNLEHFFTCGNLVLEKGWQPGKADGC